VECLTSGRPRIAHEPGALVHVLFAPDRPWVLMDGAYYRVVADALPRELGHVLLITRAHVLHHAIASAAWRPELEAPDGPPYGFLLENLWCGELRGERLR
jgi:hypothetical protein